MILCLIIVAICVWLLYLMLHGSSWGELTSEGKTFCGALIFLIVFGLVGFFIVASLGSGNTSYSGSSSGWDSLTDEEKEWYEDNYGDGQYEAIRDAIDNYKGY